MSVGFSTRRQKKFPRSLDSILYVTEGTLLHLLENAVFTHILIDEFHEHSGDVDVLLMIVRGLLFAQPGLKLIVMSATLRIGILRNYFSQLRGTSLNLTSGAHRVHDYYIDDAHSLKDATWTCPSQIIHTVVLEFQKISKCNSFLRFLADKAEINACQSQLSAKLDSKIKVVLLHSGVADAEALALVRDTQSCPW